MSTTLTQLIVLVRDRANDQVQEGYAKSVGDGVTERFSLPDANIIHDSLTVQVDGVASTSFSVDEASGWVRFTVIPGAPSDADEKNITFSYQYTIWSDAQIIEAVNAAIDDCYGALVVEGENAALTSNGASELLCTTTAGADLSPEDVVERVEYWSDPHWVTLHDWRAKNHSGRKYIHFRRRPLSGAKFRISYIKRPTPLSLVTDTLEATAGLPARAREPVILFACAKLISQQLNALTHSNLFYNAEGKNATRVLDLRMRVQDLQAEGELALRKAKPRRVVRGI